jgi:hypothetical protein
MRKLQPPKIQGQVLKKDKPQNTTKPIPEHPKNLYILVY